MRSDRLRENWLARVALGVAYSSILLPVLQIPVGILFRSALGLWWPVVPTAAYIGMFLSTVGVVLGAVAYIEIIWGKAPRSGIGNASAGMVISCVVCVFAVIVAPTAAEPRTIAPQASCMSNVKQLGIGAMMYAKKNGDRYPHAARWVDETLPYARDIRIYVCPDADHEISYAFNARLDGLSMADVKSPSETVLIFESAPGKNRHGGPELLPREPRHNGGYNIVFADGRGKCIRKEDLRKLRWQP